MQTNEPTSNQEQTNTPPAAEVPASQKPVTSKPIVSWLLVSLVVLLIGTTGVFAYKYFRLKRQIDNKQPVPSVPPTKVTTTGPSPAPSPLPTADPTTNWKTYSNSRFGYSFKYPETWEPNRGPGNISDEELSSQRDVDFYDPSLPGEDPGTGFTVKVNELNATGASKDCSSLEDCFTKTFSWLDKGIITDKQNVSFLGEQAITFTYQRKTALYSQTWKYLYFLHKNNAYNIHISTESSREGVIFDIFDMILSTFKYSN
ncbi:hypothetical protein COU96_02585 [Candidatus Shapirobacteria bacterium CG10_big_fil_rev_8_21_14_0_10_38_14]|uniref:PsbP C-terminal domain-containing protein n=1 Tax=Candidatus Shapirobacteria bacterium CG10_big_fil_rev_8_21_14_0_10_38_14 TaxID=1974483 RepID=A0A2M8L506_9BACT|nr:MAG: hypothetical protein COU96_02585 [Candidatus Shapirobacteria bacterium CG10_big_fil_rev_8_21_14_0_10_38_14]